MTSMVKPLRARDLDHMSPIAAAQIQEPLPLVMAVLCMITAFIAAAIIWACVAQVDVIASAPARVVPVGREQVVASLEGGLLREIKVSEGEQVQAGQVLAVLDPTRMQAQQNEGQARRLVLLAALARAEAESQGRAPVFPPQVREHPDLVAREMDSMRARDAATQMAVQGLQQSAALLRKELATSQAMAGRGLLSDVEVNRLQRQVNEVEQAARERLARRREEAASQVVTLRGELDQIDQQMVARDDAVARTLLRSPIQGYVKAVLNPTVGGVVTPGAAVFQVVALSEQPLVELRISPADIGFVHEGQTVRIKLSAYDPTVYGTLSGKVAMIGPDANGEGAQAEQVGIWYRALVRADAHNLRRGNQPLQVRPGMQGTAEIRVGERSVMSYILRPMLRSRDAFRER